MGQTGLQLAKGGSNGSRGSFSWPTRGSNGPNEGSNVLNKGSNGQNRGSNGLNRNYNGPNSGFNLPNRGFNRPKGALMGQMGVKLWGSINPMEPLDEQFSPTLAPFNPKLANFSQI